MTELDLMTVTIPILPVPGDRIRCGNRMYLFKKQRSHTLIPLGTDFKNKGIEGICEVEVFACASCGMDKRE